jgi:hypothetical protein
MFIPGHLTNNKYGKIIDKYFQKYETYISPIISKICSQYNTFKMSDWEFLLLSGFIESQYIRVPKIADVNNNIIIDLLKYILPNTDCGRCLGTWSSPSTAAGTIGGTARSKTYARACCTKPHSHPRKVP